jgi:hypothetical protein
MTDQEELDRQADEYIKQALMQASLDVDRLEKELLAAQERKQVWLALARARLQAGA